VRLAIALGVGAEVCKEGTLFTLRRMVWRQALLSAELCRLLASGRGVSPDEAFVCGLLHDFGKAIGIACIEQILSVQESRPILSPERCQRVVEAYHVELGGVMAATWRLSPLVSEVITGHHPAQLDSTALSQMLQLVIASDHIVELLERAPTLTMTDLATVPFLTDNERIRTVKLVGDLPAVVQSFDPSALAGSPVGPRSAVDILARPRSALPGDIYPVAFAIECPCGEQLTLEYRASYLGDRGIGMRGEVVYDPTTTNLRVDGIYHADEVVDLAAGDVFKVGVDYALWKQFKV